MADTTITKTRDDMTKKDKQLLLVDLCARLPYGVYAEHIPSGLQGKINNIDIRHKYNGTNSVQELECNVMFFDDGEYIDISYFKPCLRPMETMAEEERKELKKLMNCDCVTDYSLEYTVGGQVDYDDFLVYYEESSKLIDWLNKKMFDYRGLIPKDLALSTEEFNPYKD